ncbi:MAG: UvrD-helicase domain-containing protein [Firmicutes bacterium]|nr:UvrD-helicase domain-containing protein [Bacillota bacterium]
MATLTKAQQLARDHLDGDVLIAAGAGSGKTKVLTERVLKLLLVNKVPLQRLLMLTFTNAAAAEMKARIRKELLAAKAFDLASQIDAAFIMTFDAYALYLVKKYAHYLGLPNDIGVYEETLYGIERKLTLNQLFAEEYEQKRPEFLSFIKQFVINQDETLKAFILRIEQKADLLVDKISYYQQYIAQHFNTQFKDEHQEALFHFYQREIEFIQHLAIKFESSQQTEFFTTLTQNLLALPDLDALLTALTQLSFPRLKAKSISDEDKALRDKLKESLSLLKADAAMVPIAGQLQHYDATQVHVQVILDLLLELNRRLEAKKQQYHRYTFADIAKRAMQLMKIEILKQQIQDQFMFIMVDEYQDTNDLQEAFLQQLAKKNLMMVGDVKQSIYRFRNANSDIFNHKFNTFTDYGLSQDHHQCKIILQDNFRSRKEVLEGINHLFSHVMSHEVGGVHYNHEQALTFGQSLYTKLMNRNQSYHMDVVRYAKTDQDSQFNEAEIIAQDILKKLNQGVQVADLDKQTMRKATFKDFTILIDRKSNFEAYIEVFNRVGIPLEVYAERDLSDSDFFRVMKNLMTLMVHHQGTTMIKNMTQAYVSVLRSFIFQEKDDALYRLAIGKKPLTEFALFAILDRFQNSGKHQVLGQWMQALIQALQLETKLLTLSDLPANLARLEGWMHTVEQLSALGYSLEAFETFLKQTDSIDVDLTITANIETDNAVKLMTIHKSKGLEFSYVYYPGLSKGFNMVETKGMYQYSKTYGIQLPYPEATYARPIFADLILNEEKEAILSEQMRLWYVALTRAKENITLVMESSQPKTIVDIEKARSFADVMQVYDQITSRDISRDSWVLWPIEFAKPATSTQTASWVPITFKQLSHSFETIPAKRASKELDEEVDAKVLMYGTYLHECLFLLDFATLDTSFITNTKDRALIDKLLANPIMQNLANQVKQGKAQVLKEYAYLDEKTGQTSIIDLLILEGKDATIIDYKTNQIEDEAYEKQLLTYAKFIKSQGFFIKDLILISISQNKFKRILLKS